MPTIVSSFNQHFSKEADGSNAENSFRIRPLAKQSPENYWVVKVTSVSCLSTNPLNDSHLVQAVIDSPLFGGQNSFDTQEIDSVGGVEAFSRSWWVLGAIYMLANASEKSGGVFSPCSDNYCILKEVKTEIFRLIFVDKATLVDPEVPVPHVPEYNLSLTFTEMSPR
jgi:hypothetical protein